MAGKTALCFARWRQLTSDAHILSWVRGVHIDFTEQKHQSYPPVPIQFASPDVKRISHEIQRLLERQVIEFASPVLGQYISNIFFRVKKDGSIRLILNLKALNLHVEYHHFKMETLQAAIQLMSRGCYLASVDLKDAYYSVPMAPQDRKYLRFVFQGQLFQFTCLPNGLAEAPRKFTKLLKVPFAHLRGQGHLSSAYIDDSCLLGASAEACGQNVAATVKLMDDLGFTVHPEKSSLEPSHILVYLGFILNSLDMTVTLTATKIDSIITMCRALLHKQFCTIRQLAEVIGSLVAAEPGVMLAPLHYKRLEHENVRALKQARGDYEGSIIVSRVIRTDLDWWIENLPLATRRLEIPDPMQTIFTDSSSFVWGASCDNQDKGGPWVREERDWHINRKELRVAFFGLKAFAKNLSDCHVQLRVDNTTAVAYINNQGGKNWDLNEVARELWL